jgi:hypothetical protein
MEIINHKKITRLMQKSGQFLISLYMPTHRAGHEMQQDPIRFKNLLTNAGQHLSTKGLNELEVKSILRKAQMLQSDTKFWQHQCDGLALFTGEKFLDFFRLPIKFEELLILSNRLHLKPLLPLLSKNSHYYVLALSQNNVRLLEGSLFGIDEVDLEDIPTSIREALMFDDPEKQIQFHTGTNTPGSGAGRPAIFHGQGASVDDTKTDLLRYFQKIDDGLMQLIGDEQAPMVLAGVNYLLPIYQEANSYSNLANAAIEGNPDRLIPQDLHKQAWKIVEPIFQTEQHEELSRYQMLIGSQSQLASNNLEKIVSAAHYGRVETLFIALDTQLWGRFDAQKNSMEFHQAFNPGDQDLLDLAAVQTLLNGGAVFALEPEIMPNSESIAAIFRYSS